MNFFSRIFDTNASRAQQPAIRFGRYTDVYKTEQQLDCWDQAISHFEEEKYLESYQKFFEYLLDQDLDNVKQVVGEKHIDFEFYQGSKKIIGFATAEKLKAESKIARTHELNIAFLRRLVESNYDLKYGRYCLDPQGDISIVFDTLSLDASPYKIYYALKEIALASDKHDDLLVEEFATLERVHVAHINAISNEEKQVKIEYLRNEISKTLDRVRNGKLRAQQYPGGITYLLLELVYRLDFLVRPEGSTMEAFERMHRNYFAANKFSPRDKNDELISEFEHILERSTEKFSDELYDTVSTFGITNPSTHKQLTEFIQVELENMDWYLENRYFEVAMAIPDYIVGYSLFYYSLTEVDRDFFLLYMQIMHQDYFTSLGFDLDFAEAGLWGSLDRGRIVDAIEQISEEYESVLSGQDPNVRSLQFEDKPRFAKSYLEMISELKLSAAS